MWHQDVPDRQELGLWWIVIRIERAGFSLYRDAQPILLSSEGNIIGFCVIGCTKQSFVQLAHTFQEIV